MAVGGAHHRHVHSCCIFGLHTTPTKAARTPRCSLESTQRLAIGGKDCHDSIKHGWCIVASQPQRNCRNHASRPAMFASPLDMCHHVSTMDDKSPPFNQFCAVQPRMQHIAQRQLRWIRACGKAATPDLRAAPHPRNPSATEAIISNY